MLKKTLLATLLCATIPLTATAADPQGFNNQFSRAPQGFKMQMLNTLDDVYNKGYDNQMVVLQGRFTKQLSHELFEFTDAKGATIVCELDDDKDWSHIKKDELVEILAEIDKGFMKTELEVIEARPIK